MQSASTGERASETRQRESARLTLCQRGGPKPATAGRPCGARVESGHAQLKDSQLTSPLSRPPKQQRAPLRPDSPAVKAF